MSTEWENLLLRSEESIQAAQALLDGGWPGFAASRAYYAMFYTAWALLLSLGETYYQALLHAERLHLRLLADTEDYLNDTEKWFFDEEQWSVTG